MPQEQLAVKPYPPCKPQCGWVCHFISCKSFPGFSGGSDGKESVCNAGEPGSIPGWGRCPGGGNGNPLQFSCLENSMDRGTWWAIDHGVTKSWTWLSNQRFLREHIFQGRRGERMKLTEYQGKGRVIGSHSLENGQIWPTNTLDYPKMEWWGLGALDTGCWSQQRVPMQQSGDSASWFIYSTGIEHLLCAKKWFGFWEYIRKRDRQ